MNSKTKHHLMAITAIFLTIFVVSQLAKKPPAPPVAAVAPLSSRFIIIVSADWGINCNPAIAREIEQQQREAAQKKPNDKLGTEPATPPLALLKENNALIPLTNLCGNKEICEFEATTEILGSPVKSCLKTLQARYRCFEYDKLQHVEGREGEKITIDCRESKPKESSK